MVKIRVAIVVDSALQRGLLAQSINGQPDMVCIGSANDALAARELLRNAPDVVVLDAQMARLEILVTLSRLMRTRPTPVVMLSSRSAESARLVLDALELGAFDVVMKPGQSTPDSTRRLAEDLLETIRDASQAHVGHARPAMPSSPRAQAWAAPTGTRAWNQVIVIGAAAGGIGATRELLSALPEGMPPLLIAQRLPAGFTATHAARLDAASRLTVVEARDGELLHPDHAYVAPGAREMWIEPAAAQQLRVRVGEPALPDGRAPAVERLFASAARAAGADAIGVMLSGSGCDGALAMRAMRDAGAWNVAQDTRSCVAPGMPAAAVARGAVHEVLPLSAIAPRLIERLRGVAKRATEALA